MDITRIFNGKKFMWDGENYPDEKNAEETAQKYKGDGFEVELVEDGAQYYLFTRRVVKEIVIEGKPI